MKIKSIMFALILVPLVTVVGCKKDKDSTENIPTVTSTNPENGATNVIRNKNISVIFSEIMDPATLTTSTFGLKKGTSDVPGSVTSSLNAVSFSPTIALEPNTVYTAIVTTGAKIRGNSISN